VIAKSENAFSEARRGEAVAELQAERQAAAATAA